MSDQLTLTRLDRTIAVFAPARAYARLQARLKSQALIKTHAKYSANFSAMYDGAAMTQRTQGKRIASSSADREIWRSLRRLRDVSRELCRNNPYAARAVAGIAANVIGTGIMPSVRCASPRRKAAVEALVDAHLATTAIDFDERHNLFGLQTLVMRTIVEGGEALIVRYQPPARLKLTVPVQIRVLEGDYLDQLKGSTWGLGAMAGPPIPDGHRVVQGVEFDKDGRRCAYWLFDEHPGDGLLTQSLFSKRVPAQDVLHIYRADRPGQTRGVPWGASVIIPLWDLGDFEDAEMMRQKIAACFAIFYTDPDQRMTLAGSVDDQGQPITSQAGTPVDVLEPGMIQKLPAGADVKFATPPGTHGYEAYVREQKRKISVGFGVPYEMMTGDLSQVNFSSGRMGWLEFQRAIYQWQWHMLIPQMCDGVAKWFLEAAAIAGNSATPVSLAWSEPRREMIDPTREIAAMRDAIRSGLTSRSEELRGLGCDPAKIDAEIAADQKRADKLGLVLDSDGRVPLQGPRGDSNPQDDAAGGEEKVPLADPAKDKPKPAPKPSPKPKKG